MKRFIHIIFISLIAGNIAACAPGIASLRSPIQSDAGFFRPSKMFMRGMPASNDSYSQGIRDGCETFMGIVGGGTLRLLPSKLDGYRLSQDKLYARGFMDGGNHCTHSLDWDTH